MKSDQPTTDNRQPPRWAQQFIEWYCKPQIAEDLIGDLNEYFERNVERIGVRRAKIIYAIDAIKFLRPYTVRTPKYINLLINWIMIGSYIKTSGRNVMRNKLFSSINIVGLAISMSVGLLLIAFVHDLLSYDRFHENGDRIYRVITWPGKTKNESNEFASSSIKTARLIREKVSGVEETALMRVGFEGDAVVGENTLPVEGMWADPSLFKVFTFPFVKGDPSTALSKPYSVVLTEQSAKKMFGDKDPLGQTVRFDTAIFEVTGVLKDIPRTSHLRFEALGSFSTLEQKNANNDRYDSWGSIWSNYTYILVAPNGDVGEIESQLKAIAAEENAVANENNQRDLNLQALYDIVLGKDLSNANGPTISIAIVWVLSGLAFVVILSACFNYTNLSIARSMRRFKEVGLRKAIGANKGQVRQQFVFEAIIISLLALIVSFAMFLVLRGSMLDLAPELQNIATLQLTPTMVVLFVVFSIAVGVIAGFLPALFFAKISVIHALRDASSVKIFKRVNLRRALIILQYTLTLMFITTTVIGYKQYKSFLVFDLGFTTENILNIELQGNKSENLIKELNELPEVEGISRSIIINSVGNYWGGHAKYKTTNDSTLIWYNIVDENYFKLHDYKFIAGQSFVSRPATEGAVTDVIANENILKKLSIADGDPLKAIGEEVVLDGKKRRIVGVVKDFHYGKVDNPIEPVFFIQWNTETDGWLNLKVHPGDPVALRAKIEDVWKRLDKVHPINARFYKESIERSYSEFSVMITVIGFLSLLAITIASMGLFGMVVFTTETRLKEISIRKVMGAKSINLILLLSRGFMILLGTSALVALPATYFLFEDVILTNFPFHQPVGIFELFIGTLVVLLIAFLMIASQTTKATRTNPAEILRSE